MTEMESRETGIDALLRRTMAAQIPHLPAGFDERVVRNVGRKPGRGWRPLDRSSRLLLAGYGFVSMVTSAIVMRSQGLGWLAISCTTLTPLVLAVTRPLWRAARTQGPHAAS